MLAEVLFPDKKRWFFPDTEDTPLSWKGPQDKLNLASKNPFPQPAY